MDGQRGRLNKFLLAAGVLVATVTSTGCLDGVLDDKIDSAQATADGTFPMLPTFTPQPQPEPTLSSGIPPINVTAVTGPGTGFFPWDVSPTSSDLGQ